MQSSSLTFAPWVHTKQRPHWLFCQAPSHGCFCMDGPARLSHLTSCRPFVLLVCDLKETRGRIKLLLLSLSHALTLSVAGGFRLMTRRRP